MRRAIGDPLANSALLSSVLVLPALDLRPQRRQPVAGLLFPLAGRRVVGACPAEPLGRLFAAHQTALAFAALAAATALDETRRLDHPRQAADLTPNLLERIASVSHVVLDPRNLQAYGVALGLLSLVWVVVRIVDLRRGIAAERLLQGALQRRLVHPPWRGR